MVKIKWRPLFSWFCLKILPQVAGKRLQRVTDAHHIPHHLLAVSACHREQSNSWLNDCLKGQFAYWVLLYSIRVIIANGYFHLTPGYSLLLFPASSNHTIILILLTFTQSSVVFCLACTVKLYLTTIPHKDFSVTPLRHTFCSNQASL